VPPWYNWAKTANADDTAGPDGGIVLPATLDDCDIFIGNYTPGGVTPPHWGVVSGANSMRVSNVGQPDAGCAMEEKEGKIGPCALLCCAYCKADKDCVMAELANGGNCAIAHADPKIPFGTRCNGHCENVSLMCGCCCWVSIYLSLRLNTERGGGVGFYHIIRSFAGKPQMIKSITMVVPKH
jgi:hypothetical protein